MTIIKHLLIATVVATIGFLQPAPSWSKSTDAPIGSKHKSSIQIGNSDVVVPLPEGEWEVVGSDTLKWSAGTKKLNVNARSLVKVIDKKLHGVIYLNIPDRKSINGFEEDKFCNRKDIHHIVNNGNFRKGRDCWGVNHFRYNVWDKAPKMIKQTFKWFSDNKIPTPPNMIDVEFSVVNDGRFIKAMYFFNPDVDGIAQSRSAEWDSTDWHPAKIYQFPEKQAYVKSKIAWGEAWHKKILAAVGK